jgi:hypothetical protein
MNCPMTQHLDELATSFGRNSRSRLHVDECGQDRPQAYRRDFRCVLRCESLEHAPGYPAEDLANDQCLNVGCKEKNENEGSHRHQSTNHGLPITITLTDESIDEQADHFTGSCSVRSDAVRKCAATRSWDHVRLTEHFANSPEHCTCQ